MLIGQAQSGKTSLKRSLKGERFDSKERRTTGIEMHTVYRKVLDIWKEGGKPQTAEPRPIVDSGEVEKEVHEVFWDFGGQSDHYITHPLFLTARGMYCLVYNASQDPAETVSEGSNMGYLNTWMFLVSSLLSGDQELKETPASEMLPGRSMPPVFLVCTHTDEPYRSVQPEELAREITGSLQTPLNGKPFFDVFMVNNTKSGSEQECPEVSRLKKEIVNLAEELPQMKEVIPIKWLNYEKVVVAMVEGGCNWITFDDSKNIAFDICGISSDEQFLALLNFLHDKRILIYFKDTPKLNTVVILNLQWLTGVFRNVLTVPPDERIERKSINWWRKLKEEGILDKKLLRHVWRPFFHGRNIWKSLIAIMEKLCLLCPRSSLPKGALKESYLVPSMVMSPPKEDVAKLITSTGIPSLFVKFESGQVLPGLFPRLVLMFFQWCTKEWLWQSEPELHRNFARFHRYPAEDCSVILLCHSSFIEVAVTMEDNALHPSSESSHNSFK